MYSKKFIEDLEIVDYLKINDEFFVIELLSKDSLPVIYPGQFVQVLVKNSPGTFLRRPLSIHDVDTERNTIKLLVQIVGDGTRELANLDIGDTLSTIYPLGNSFTLSNNNEDNILLIGGGCGVAPLLLLAKHIVSKGIKPDILIGGRSKDYLLRVDEYSKIANVYVTTEDGSVGEKGFVIHHSILWNEHKTYNKIYTCGPDAMMKAVAKYAHKKNIDCEVSLENLMACGIGACLCCITETVEGNKCTCIDGPVFNSNYLKWQI